MQLRGLKVDVLLPDLACLHVTSNTLNSALKDLFDLLIGISAQILVLVLQER